MLSQPCDVSGTAHLGVVLKSQSSVMTLRKCTSDFINDHIICLSVIHTHFGNVRVDLRAQSTCVGNAAVMRIVYGRVNHEAHVSQQHSAGIALYMLCCCQQILLHAVLDKICADYAGAGITAFSWDQMLNIQTCVSVAHQ